MANGITTTGNGNGAVATPAKRGETLKELINSDTIKSQIARALPKHCTADRFLRVATTALLRTPKLAQCTQASFMQALLDLSSLGLEPDNRRAYLIPFENRKKGVTECQLIVGYQGYVELVRNSGCVSTIQCNVVCERDQFEFSFGSDGKLVHRPQMADRGKVIAAYAYVRLKDGSEQYEVMSVEDVNKIRARSRTSGSGPWVTDYEEMAKKTVFRRLRKWLPISPEIRNAFDLEDSHENESRSEVAETDTRSLEDIIESDDDEGTTQIAQQIGDEPDDDVPAKK